MNRIKVLLVDDHAVVRDGIHYLLNSQPDMEVVGEAAEGNEAIAKAIETKPDVIIMDLSMPNGRDGLSTTSEVLQILPETKVLILSMYDDNQYLFRALKAGASGYILKSSLGKELLGAIRQVYNGQAYLHPGAQKKIIERFLNGKIDEEEDSYDLLTEREKEILSLVAKGYTNKEVGDLLNISSRTVETHKANIMEKLELTTRKDLIRFAVKRGLLEFND
ncbi:response regulator transcription factor [Calidifontibacillus erzurumensis]|uniref:Response regulator transcription factor n=1 Tax=Calidifontibacillus erzurumensis TaxID=2741433 RepID=A0A8J8KC42_9BACI|nr:response regulator transcription factor [Calidifontibacillus erzurumensis]NSL52644.1 response regulator transcription factor [Calidifontibacillus erzurumensis]